MEVGLCRDYVLCGNKIFVSKETNTEDVSFTCIFTTTIHWASIYLYKRKKVNDGRLNQLGQQAPTENCQMTSNPLFPRSTPEKKCTSQFSKFRNNLLQRVQKNKRYFREP